MALSLGSLNFDVLLVPHGQPDASPINAGVVSVDLPPLRLDREPAEPAANVDDSRLGSASD